MAGVEMNGGLNKLVSPSPSSQPSLPHMREQAAKNGSETFVIALSPLPQPSSPKMSTEEGAEENGSVIMVETAHPHDPKTNPNIQVTGTIDGTFESGYFVTVNVPMNGKKLKGILFPTEETTTAGTRTQGPPSTILKRKLKQIGELDPKHPKTNRSGYTFFFAEQYARMKPFNEGTGRDITKKIGHLWRNLPESEKTVYRELALKDKKRYEREMMVYRERK